jgi:hypothetical protein
MPKPVISGAAIPVRTLADADLRANGGAYSVLGRTAWRVRFVDADDYPVESRTAVPVVKVTQAQVDAGDYVVVGTVAVYAVAEIEADTAVQARAALPVFVE